jgi:hypothetical protein
MNLVDRHAALGRRTRARILSFVPVVIAAALLVACRDKGKGEEPAPSDKTEAIAAPTSVTSPATGASAAVDEGAEEVASAALAGPPDAGADADAGARRRRHLAARAGDAGAEKVPASTDPAPTARLDALAEGGRRGKRPPPNMGDDDPYGRASSAAPVLEKKKKMAGDDPWAKPTN